MKEHPILFTGPMVRALLDGSKTQTRRVVKRSDEWPASAVKAVMLESRGSALAVAADRCTYGPEIKCPHGQPGDRLWVREAWTHDAESLEQCRSSYEDALGGGAYGPYYRATEVAPDTLNWRPSIHMPRWASRITLEITSVRVERLQDISETDALAEGVKNSLHLPGGRFARENYGHLWWTIHGDGSWEANPWVWVVEFKVVQP